MVQAHMDALETKHADLDRRIESETLRPRPDEILLHDLKKRKLRIKEEMAFS